ncbi:MAG: helix-turn-helix domain-containing protein [Pseudomonadota bacterium]
MATGFTILIIGFSVFGAVILLLAYTVFMRQMPKTLAGTLACTVLLATLAGLQLQHFRFLRSGVALFEAADYVVLLLLAPPAFYFFSREILLPERRPLWRDLVHAGPLLLFVALPASIVAPIAFLIGTGYAFWFARLVFGMRRQKRRFRFEMFFFSLFAVLAVLVLVLGLSIPYLNPALFYFGYANAIGLSLLLVVAALIIFPEILSDISEAAQATYASSTLTEVDVDAVIGTLERLMRVDKVFQNEALSLSSLAEELDLSAHQLSELVNTRFGIGFSRYIREYRVAEARRLLEQDASASVLSIGLSTGFRSQSNFYAAFRDITGVAPGTYRKNRKTPRSDSQ